MSWLDTWKNMKDRGIFFSWSWKFGGPDDIRRRTESIQGTLREGFTGLHQQAAKIKDQEDAK